MDEVGRKLYMADFEKTGEFSGPQKGFSPAENFGVSAKLGPLGTLGQSSRKVPRFQVRVPSTGSEVPSEGSGRF